ncbi:hypothetical protein LOTGIDRAFT_168958 [Lottia gigantea]|uniref:Uncharacterized protein n=1 Tax=Lottia gigantea TaxID=225164 RepID=V4B5G7_LOTGI|nr:hypothetical protein LOTGIDRAFT_168958 [Lottia gigantea]ESO83714.1 hypothetical protein LOTGIDRAFT_168958 [Lottia gigantea]
MFRSNIRNSFTLQDMMDPLMDSLLDTQWKLVTTETRGDGFKEYKLMRQHAPEGKNGFRYLIQEEDNDPQRVIMLGCKEGHDPLKDIGTCELKLNGDGKEIIGVDLDGDAAVKIA